MEMGGSTSGGALPYYSPQNFTISIGDIVRWTNVSGSHSANGSLANHPTNPAGFSSGNPQSGNWSWEFTFTVPGVYHYDCTQDGHSATQFGTITVLNNVGIAEVAPAVDVNVFPIPASEQLFIETTGNTLRTATVVDLDGATVLSMQLNASGRTSVDITTLAAGKYFVLITTADGRVTAKPFTKG